MTKNDICNMALMTIGGRKIDSFENNDSQEATVINFFYNVAKEEVLNEHSWNFCTKRILLEQSDISLSACTLSDSGGEFLIENVSHSLSSNDKIRIEGSNSVLDGEWFLTTPNTSSFILKDSEYVAGVDVSDAFYNKIPESEWQYSFPLPSDFERAIALENQSKSYSVENGNLLTNKDSVVLKYISNDLDETSFPLDVCNLISTLLASMIAQSLNGPATKQYDYRRLYEELLRKAKSRDSKGLRTTLEIGEGDSLVIKARMGGIY